MKKLTISFLAVILSVGSAFAQPVSDMAIIPIGVTLNSILRLNVTNGGSLEYVINTMDDYTNGIPNSTTYTTNFTVASSVDFDVVLTPDNGTFIGVDVAAGPNVLPLTVLEYEVEDAAAANIRVLGAVTALPETIVTAGPAGDIVQNQYAILWALGETVPLLGFAADRYVLNIYLELAPN